MAEVGSRPTTIDEYVARFPLNVGEKLQEVRAAIQKAAPEAREVIKYGVPAFTLHGPLVHFGAFGDHIDFYPLPSGVGAFASELARYTQGRGSAQFPLDRPLPLKLIVHIVKLRAAQNLEKALSRPRAGR